MSRLYDNIKVLCKYKGVQIRDIEKPLRAGTISRYERRGTIMNLPIGLVHRASKLLDVSIEDLLEKDIANEIWGEKMSNEIYGIFKRSELSDELVEDLHKQVDLILEYAKKQKAEQTEPNSSEKPNNCEPQICETCRYYNSYIPCGSTPSACKEADKFAEEFVDGLKKLKPKDEPQYDAEEVAKDINRRVDMVKKEWNARHMDEPQTDCAWR